MPAQTNITLTPEQESFVRQNYGKMSRSEMCEKLGITKGKLSSNIYIMPELSTNRKIKQTDPDAYYFNVNECACWITGIKSLRDQIN